jgi:hypothetical protein
MMMLPLRYPLHPWWQHLQIFLGMTCAQTKELLEPTLENNDEDEDSNDDGNGGGMCGGEFNEVAAMAAKSKNDDDDHSNDDGNDGSGGSGKCNDNNYDNNDNGGGECSPTGKGLYYPDDDAFLDDIFDDDYVKKHFSAIPDASWAAAKKKGHPKKDARKL